MPGVCGISLVLLGHAFDLAPGVLVHLAGQPRPVRPEIGERHPTGCLLRCGPAGTKKYVLAAVTDRCSLFFLGARTLESFREPHRNPTSPHPGGDPHRNPTDETALCDTFVMPVKGTEYAR